MDESATTIFYFWYRCAHGGCSLWLESTDIDGDVAHWPAVCPYCGSPLVEVGPARAAAPMTPLPAPDDPPGSGLILTAVELATRPRPAWRRPGKA